MTLRGSVETIALVDLLQVIQGNGHAGTLKVTSGERTSKLYFYKGQIFLPMSGSGGALKIGALLVRAGKITGQDLVRALSLNQDGPGEKLGEVLVREGLVKPEDLDALVRKQFEEEIYDVLFREDAYFEWKRDVLPAGFADAKGNIRAKDFDTRSILMEASRRQDEWRRIRARIPSTKAVYRLGVPGEPATGDDEVAGEAAMDLDEPPDEGNAAIALEALRKAGTNLDECPFDGSRSLDDIVALTNLPAFEALGVIARLREQNVVRPIADAEIEARALKALADDRVQTAYKLYAWTNEVERLWPIASALDRELLKPSILSQAAQPAFAGRTGGIRALTILSRLLRRGAPFHFHGREEDCEIDVYLAPKALRLQLLGSKRPHSFLRSLRARGAITEEQLKAAREVAHRTGRDVDRVLLDDRFVTREAWLLAVKDKIVSGMFSTFEWKEPFVEFTANAKAPPATADVRGMVVEVPLDESLREDLRKDLLRWKSIVSAIPTVDVIFVRTGPTPPPGKKMRMQDLLDGRRTVGDLLALAKVAPLELVRFLLDALLDQRIRRLTDKEHDERFQSAMAQGRLDDAQAYVRSALAFGFSKESYQKRQVEIRERTKGMASDRRSTVQGELGNVSLAEVLQLLHQGKRNGTLRIVDQDGLAEKRLYLDGGEVFLLDVQEGAHDDELVDLLGESTGEHLGLGGLLKGRGRVTEDAVDKAEIDRIKNGLFEAFLWEGARFEFLQNLLPPELRSDAPNVTKIALKTELLLFEAMRRLAEWDDMRKVLRSARAVFQFASTDAKKDAIAREHGSLAYLFDGTHSLADIVRSANEDRFTVYRFARSLVQRGALSFVRLKEVTTRRKLIREAPSSGRFQVISPEASAVGARIGLKPAPGRGFPGLPAGVDEDSVTDNTPPSSRVASSRPGFLGSVPTDSVSSDSVSEHFRPTSSSARLEALRPAPAQPPKTPPQPQRAVGPASSRPATPPPPAEKKHHAPPPGKLASSRPAFPGVASQGGSSRPAHLQGPSTPPPPPARNPKPQDDGNKKSARSRKPSERKAASSARRKPPEGGSSRH